MINEAAIRRRFETLGPYLDERQRRVFATSEALAAGWGGIAAVSRITGIARSTIGRGLDEIVVGGAWRVLPIENVVGGRMVECAGWGLAANCWKRPTRG